MPFEIQKPLFIAGTMLPAFASGIMLSMSVYSMPAIGLNPSARSSLIQWRYVFEKGLKTMPPLAAIAAIINCTNAYIHFHPQARWRTYTFVASAIAAVSAVPFTLLAIRPTNNAIYAKLASLETTLVETDSDLEEARGLISQWSFLNTVRAALPLIGSYLAYEAL